MSHEITTEHLDRWSSSAESRHLLPVLVRRLVHETFAHKDILRMDFPGYEQTDHGGFDGELEIDSQSQHVPHGKSVWEFGTSKDPGAKATEDFKKRTKCCSDPNATFIFVSSRKWPNKQKWLEKRQSEEFVKTINPSACWKGIRGYDASDLEQWIEFCPFTNVWLAEKMGISKENLITPKKFLKNWEQATIPKFPADILFSNRRKQKAKLQEHLLKRESGSEFSVVADTREEALAFASAALLTSDDLKDSPAMIIKTEDGFSEVLQSVTDLATPVLLYGSIELAKKSPEDLISKTTSVVACVREEGLWKNKYQEEKKMVSPGVMLGRIENFDSIFENKKTSKSVYRDAGGSLSAAHRKHKKPSAKKAPPWEGIAENSFFLWLSLVGSWDETFEPDRGFLSELTGMPYENFVDSLDNLHKLEESPLAYTYGENRGYKLFSRLDSFFLTKGKLRHNHIQKFLKLSASVFIGEAQGVDLSGAKKSIYNYPTHSLALRSGIAEGITILNLNKNFLESFDITNDISHFLDEIFSKPESLRILADVLPQIAEISPEEFLLNIEKILNQHQKSDGNTSSELSNFFAAEQGCGKLLQALQLIAWDAGKLLHVLRILCKLQDIFENHGSGGFSMGPGDCLYSILKPWMPQTSAICEQRKSALEALHSIYPVHATYLALRIADGGDQYAFENYMPKWTPYALEVEEVERDDVDSAVHGAINLILSSSLGSEFTDLQKEDIVKKIIDNIVYWTQYLTPGSGASIDKFVHKIKIDEEKIPGRVYEHARQAFLATKRRLDRGYEVKNAVDTLNRICNHFMPGDLVAQNAYLFSARPKIEFSFKELENPDKLREKIKNLQTEALHRIYDMGGIDDMLRLANSAQDTEVVARLLYENFIAGKRSMEFPIARYIADVIRLFDDIHRVKLHFSEIFGATLDHGNIKPLDAKTTISVIEEAMGLLSNSDGINDLDQKEAFLLHALRIDEIDGMDYIERLPEKQKQQYFSFDRIQQPAEFSASEKKDRKNLSVEEWLVKKYLLYRRPRLGWVSVRNLDRVPFVDKLELLDAMFHCERDVGGSADVYPHSESVQSFFDQACAQQDLAEDFFGRLAMLEFKFYEMLNSHQVSDNPRFSFINSWIGKRPEFFVELHQAVYKPGGNQNSTDQEKPLPSGLDARTAIDVLYDLNLLSSEYSWVCPRYYLKRDKLLSWIQDVRKFAATGSREKVVDTSIGRGLSWSFRTEYNIEPQHNVCEILEHIQNADVLAGFHEGLYNSRGVLSGDVDQMGYTTEELAGHYDKISASVLEHGYRSVSIVLRSLAQSYRRDADRQKGFFGKQDLNSF